MLPLIFFDGTGCSLATTAANSREKSVPVLDGGDFPGEGAGPNRGGGGFPDSGGETPISVTETGNPNRGGGDFPGGRSRPVVEATGSITTNGILIINPKKAQATVGFLIDERPFELNSGARQALKLIGVDRVIITFDRGGQSEPARYSLKPGRGGPASRAVVLGIALVNRPEIG